MKEVLLKVKESKLQFFLELIKNLDFVQIEELKEDTDEEIRENVRQGLKELQQYKNGTLKTVSAKDFMNEL